MNNARQKKASAARGHRVARFSVSPTRNEWYADIQDKTNRSILNPKPVDLFPIYTTSKTSPDIHPAFVNCMVDEDKEKLLIAFIIGTVLLIVIGLFAVQILLNHG